MKKVFFWVISICIVHPSIAQVADTIYLNNGKKLVGTLLEPVLGANPEDRIPIKTSNGIIKQELKEVSTIIYNEVTYVSVKFKIGKTEFQTFGNQYYFGKINLYEGRVKRLGKVQLIEREGKIQPLLAENYRGILMAYLGSCFSKSQLTDPRKVTPNYLILLLDEYHTCVNSEGTSRRLKEKKSLQIGIELGAGLVPFGSVSFNSNQFEFVRNRSDLETANGLEESQWNTRLKENVSFSIYAQSSFFKIGPVVRFYGFDLSTDMYNVGPFFEEDVYSQYDMEFRNVDLGFRFTFQPNSNKPVSPYLNLALFKTVSNKFDYTETKFESINYTNNPLTISHSKQGSYLVGLGAIFKNFGVELGLHNTFGSIFIDGPTYNYQFSQFTGYDKGDYVVLQFYLSLSYNLKFGDPITRKLYH